MRKRIFLIGGATVSVIGVAAFGFSTLGLAASTPPSPPRVGGTPASVYGVTGPFSESKVPALAKAVAAYLGDPAPSLIQHVAVSTRQEANALMSGGGEQVSGTRPSYVVAMRGHFSDPSFVTPQEAPTGITVPTSWSVEVLVIDAATGIITDSGGGFDFPDLGARGDHVVTDSSPTG
jgi:hypothetical protein